ncbi:MAG: Hpt domain-containing protein [Alphaproteobacteria bacterium]
MRNKVATSPAGQTGFGIEDPAVDFDHLQRFTMGNRELECEVLNLFRTQSKLLLEKLHNASDDRAWLEAAHTMKGSAAGIGAWRVQEAAAKVEKLDRAQRRKIGQSLLCPLEETLREADQFIAAFLND